MIYESFPWKEYLLKISKSLKSRQIQKRWTSRTSFLFEKEIFTSKSSPQIIPQSEINFETSCEVFAGKIIEISSGNSESNFTFFCVNL